MHSLTESQLLFALVALAVVLVVARAGGEIARRIGQPEVLGELFAGFILGPSVFGALLPSPYHTLFLDKSVSLVLSGFSWVGAIMLLLIAGLEVDLAILRREVKPGALGATFAIIPSLVVGSVFAWMVLGQTPPNGIFLGIVLSVTAVSVASKILIERRSTRRGFAQVILAAGVASEVLVWLFVAVVSSLRGGSPLQAGALHTLYAVGFFLVAMTVGRRFTFWAMRRVRDVTLLVNGQLTLVLALTFVAAAITQALGLHALLGAFVVGVLLTQAPRKNEALLDRLQSLTVGLFGPIFFALAGMRVDILQLGSLSSVGVTFLLLAIATFVKAGFGTLGARLGGVRGWESMLVGVGLNLKGGTDVVVAVIGTELGLLSIRAYSMYAVVAILTVLFSPALMSFLERRSPPTEDEEERLETEEAQRRSYVPRIERVLVPIDRRLHSTLAASVVQQIAASKHEQGQIFDITQLEVQKESRPRETAGAAYSRDRLSEASGLGNVQVTRNRVDGVEGLVGILETSESYDLIAIGARPPEPNRIVSLGELQDVIIDQAKADVLVAVDGEAEHFDCERVNRILVPISGMGYSLAAGDLAASLAEACNAELIILHVVQDDLDELSPDRDAVIKAGKSIVEELVFRVRRLGVRYTERMESGKDVGDTVLRELESQPYDLVVLGGVDRSFDERVNLGTTIQTVLTKAKTPAVLLVSHE